MLLRVVGDSLRELLGVCQEEVHVKGAGCIENLHRGIYKGSFVGIGSPLRALAEIKREFGRASRLSHPLSSWLENREQMFSVALSIASWSMFVNAFGLSGCDAFFCAAQQF